MFKVIFFLWKRAGMSRGEFINYYEVSHANLGKHEDGSGELLVPIAIDYRRNYPLWNGDDGISGHRLAVFNQGLVKVGVTVCD
jgi:hypothetical protein